MGEAILRTVVDYHQFQVWVCLAKGTGDPETCCCLLAVQKAHPLKEPGVLCELGEARFRGVTRVG